MNENSIFQNAAEVFVDKPIEILITPEPKNKLHKLLIFLRFKKKSLKYQLRHTLVGNRIRIASRAVLFPEDVFENGIMQSLWQLSKTHSQDLIYIAAVAIQNNRDEPEPFLLEELKWVDDATLFTIVDKALSQIDIESFMKSTILITGTEMMKEKEKGPNEQKEIIASGD